MTKHKSGIEKMVEVLDMSFDEIALKANGIEGQVELMRILKLLSEKARSLMGLYTPRRRC